MAARASSHGRAPARSTRHTSDNVPVGRADGPPPCQVGRRGPARPTRDDKWTLLLDTPSTTCLLHGPGTGAHQPVALPLQQGEGLANGLLGKRGCPRDDVLLGMIARTEEVPDQA